MNPETLEGFLFEKFQNRDFSSIKGTRLAFHIPLNEQLLNAIIQAMLSKSGLLKDLKSLHISEMDENGFLIAIDHRKLAKKLRCEVGEIYYNHHSEPILEVKYLEGLKVYEKIALTSAISLKKSWNWFTSQWLDGSSGSEKGRTAFEVSSSKLTLNLSQLLIQNNLEYLVPLITWNDISTDENKLVIDFSIKI